MGEPFILERKRRNDHQKNNDRPKINIRRRSYDQLIQWSIETGRSIAELVEMVVDYAEKNLEYRDK